MGGWGRTKGGVIIHRMHTGGLQASAYFTPLVVVGTKRLQLSEEFNLWSRVRDDLCRERRDGIYRNCHGKSEFHFLVLSLTDFPLLL